MRPVQFAKEFMPDCERSRYFPRHEEGCWTEGAGVDDLVKEESACSSVGVEGDEQPLVIDLESDAEDSSSEDS